MKRDRFFADQRWRILPGPDCLRLILLLGFGFAASTHAQENNEIPSIVVTPGAPALSSEIRSIDTEQLRQQSGGETLGDYLEQQPNVESSSYGPAVGRPVVRGMSGYRVKILQNDTAVSDLSAMSHDHAVGVLPRASQRIELLKGPASLIYGAQAGGAVRLVDEAEFTFPRRGLHGSIDGSLGNNNDLQSAGVNLTAASQKFSLGISAYENQTGNYQDGRGITIKDSDVTTEQSKLVAGWRYSATGRILLSAASLGKDYGIPNQTAAATRIDMQRDSYTLHVTEHPDAAWLDTLKLDLSYSDYLHDETEDGRKDGLFGQKTASLLLTADYAHADWLGKMVFGYRDNELKVCHEHGACEQFSDAFHSGVEANLGASLENFVNTRGLPFSHGHPMPDTRARSLTLGVNGEKPLGDANSQVYLSVGGHLELRDLAADPANIQETWVVPERLDASYYRDEKDFAGSISIGLRHPLGARLNSQINLSYLQRLGSADELYWNGFHHATDSYIFGNRDLDKERSINLDWDLNWSTESSDWSLSAYSYYFDGYIFQNQRFTDTGQPDIDPFHLSEVWQTEQTNARFSGFSLRQDWAISTWRQVPLILTNQLEAIRATRSNGEKLPRTAPYNWLIGFSYAPDSWMTSLTIKRVFEATATAPNETSTPAYTWVSMYADWKKYLQQGTLSMWVKGENLLNSDATNHLSFLKDTAPLMGRSISAGIKYQF